MTDIVTNRAKGRVAEFFERVDGNDPANSAIILVPLETSGLESDAVLRDKDTLADLLSGSTNEQTTMGRKTLTDAELSAITIDDTNDRVDVTLPQVTWAAATGNAVAKLAICYDADTTSGADSNITPLLILDFVATPDGNAIQLNSGVAYRAS
jgi:hypothetical protein